MQVTDFGVVAFTWTKGEKQIIKLNREISLFFILIVFYVLLIILVVEIIVPNKTSDAPNKNFTFITSLKTNPQIDPNKLVNS